MTTSRAYKSGKADPPQPEQPDLVKCGRLSISEDVDNARTTVQPLQQPHDVIHTEKDDEDEEEDSDDLRGIWDKVMDYLPDMEQISEVIKLKVYTYCVINFFHIHLGVIPILF